MNSSKRKFFFSYLFFLFLTVLLYFSTRNSGFVSDFLGWQYNFDNYPFVSVINGDAYHIKSFYHFTHLLLYAITSAFRLWGLPWFLLFSVLFALNAFLVLKIFGKIFKDLKLENGFSIAFIGVLMFMVSPYQTEVMVWRASFHYLTSFAMMLAIVYLSIRYVETSLIKYWIISSFIFLCSVFSLEFFLFTPFVVFLFILFQWVNFPGSFDIKKNMVRLVGIPLLMIAGYFIMYKNVHHNWIAHYGVENHSQILSLKSFATYEKYVIKYLGFIRYFKHTAKESIYGVFDISLISTMVLCGILSIFFLGVISFKKASVRQRLLLLNFSLFSLLLIPVITLYFPYVLFTEGDRLGYMASAFLFMGVSLMLSYLPKSIYYSIAFFLIMISISLTIKTNNFWSKSEKVFSSIVKKYESWDTSKQVLILNTPDNYEGVPMFRSYDNTSAVKEAIELYNRRKLNASFMEVAGYNMTAPDNGVHIRVDSADQIMVIFNQWGNWWWRKGIGASDYETEDYQVQFNYQGCGNCYKLTLKNNNDRVLLFQTGDRFKKVDITKQHIEQW